MAFTLDFLRIRKYSMHAKVNEIDVEASKVDVRPRRGSLTGGRSCACPRRRRGKPGRWRSRYPYTAVVPRRAPGRGAPPPARPLAPPPRCGTTPPRCAGASSSLAPGAGRSYTDRCCISVHQKCRSVSHLFNVDCKIN